MLRLIFLLPLLASCQAAPLLIKEAEEIAVEEAIQLEVHKEHGALNVSLDVNKEKPETQENVKEILDAINQERLKESHR